MANIKDRVVNTLKKQRKTGLTLKELAQRSGVKKAEKADFRQIIAQLLETNKLVEYRNKYLWAESAGILSAEIVKVTGTFGFARAEVDKDVFVPGRALLGSMPGDTVLLRCRAGTGELPEGEVLKIIKEARQRFTGVLVLNSLECQILPDKYVRFPVAVSRKKLRGAVDGDKVVAEITHRGRRHSEHFANIVETFGSADSAAACSRAVLAANNITVEFPQEAAEQARAIGAGDGIHPRELGARLDLRDQLIFTIDGADSKDLDDAVSLEKTDGGWELGVHIADVSHYVTQKSPLDQEALERGTSVYFADSVVPMLPVELSNDVCSLNPNQDRLAFSALVSLDAAGAITGYQFRKTVIKSRVKGVYGEINAILDGTADKAVLKKYKGLEQTIALMAELADVLNESRRRRGAMELESVESKIIVGADGRAVDVQPRTRGKSEQMIEEFMLVANEAAASLATQQELPFVYRVHENPAPDKLERLYEVLDKLGVSFRRPKGAVGTRQLAAILHKVEGKPTAGIVNTMVLRSMAKAKYSEVDMGHFGLSLNHYTHFTSPIRRYPDLTIHRILTGYLGGMKRENLQKRFGAFAPLSASQSTQREIAAMTAERECEDAYKAEYMRQFLGEEFDGVISSAVSFGFYVQLPNTVEGLVGLRTLPGEWIYDGVIAFQNRTTAKQLRVGDAVRVRVAAANVAVGQIDFELVLPHG